MHIFVDWRLALTQTQTLSGNGLKYQPCMMVHALLGHTPAHWPRHKLLMMLATSHAYTAIGCGLYLPAGLVIPGHTPSQARGQAKVALQHLGCTIML